MQLVFVCNRHTTVLWPSWTLSGTTDFDAVLLLTVISSCAGMNFTQHYIATQPYKIPTPDSVNLQQDITKENSIKLILASLKRFPGLCAYIYLSYN